MYKQNKAIKITPPKRLKNTAIEPNTRVIPRYIGFREYLKIPSVTNFVACSGLKGFNVVLSFLNDPGADIKIVTPPKRKKNPIKKENEISNDLKKTQEKKIDKPNIKMTMGGGIFGSMLLNPPNS